MCLTLIDIAYRINDKDMEKLAKETFEETFDLNTLRSHKFNSMCDEQKGRKVNSIKNTQL